MTLTIILCVLFGLVTLWFAYKAFVEEDAFLAVLVVFLGTIMSALLSFMITAAIANMFYHPSGCNVYAGQEVNLLEITTSNPYYKDAGSVVMMTFEIDEYKDTLYTFKYRAINSTDVYERSVYSDEITFEVDKNFKPHVVYDHYRTDSWWARGLVWRNDNFIVRTDAPVKFVQKGRIEREEN